MRTRECILRKLESANDRRSDLEVELQAVDLTISNLEDELFVLDTLNGQSIDILQPLVPLLEVSGTGHEQAIVELALTGELEDLDEWARIKHLCRQFLHITL